MLLPWPICTAQTHREINISTRCHSFQNSPTPAVRLCVLAAALWNSGAATALPGIHKDLPERVREKQLAIDPSSRLVGWAEELRALQRSDPTNLHSGTDYRRTIGCLDRIRPHHEKRLVLNQAAGFARAVRAHGLERSTDTKIKYGLVVGVWQSSIDRRDWIDP